MEGQDGGLAGGEAAESHAMIYDERATNMIGRQFGYRPDDLKSISVSPQ